MNVAKKREGTVGKYEFVGEREDTMGSDSGGCSQVIFLHTANYAGNS